MVSYIEGRMTHDGRKRAPRLLFGSNYRKPFPFFRAGLGIATMTFVCYTYYKQSTHVSPQQQFMRKIKVQPYGVLGTQMTLQASLRREAVEPDESMAITDPTDLLQVYGSAKDATGTSGSIYKWLGLSGPFPDDVVVAMNKVSDAKHSTYPGEKHVIHVSVPDFREGIWSEREAAIELSRSYRNTMHEFVMSECDTLRMVPISSDIRSGPLFNQLPKITHEALLMAFEQLHVFDKEYVLRPQKHIELCVFMNREWDAFDKVFKNLAVPA